MTDLTPNDLSHLSDEEFNALCPQGYHAPGPAEPLSAAAQAILHEFWGAPVSPARNVQIAAAFRAATKQGKLGLDHWQGSHPDERELGWNAAMTWLENVAAELEGKQ